MQEKIEDERLGGATLADAARKFNLKPVTIEAIDRNGKDAKGNNALPELPQNIDVLAAAFGAEVRGENEPLRVPGNGGYVWFDVEAITPAHDRPLDEVKDQVVARWRDDEITTRLRAKATEMLDKLKSGTPFSDAAAADTLKPEWRPGIKRSTPPPGLSPAAVAEIFKTPQDAFGSVEGPNASERIVFHVTEIKVPPLDLESADTKRIDEALRARSTEDLIAQYIARVQSDVGVSINQSALNQVSGGGTQNEPAMQTEPTADAFAARYDRGEAQVLWTTLVADLETPVSAFLKIAGSRPMSFLFESVEGGAVRGRYSVIGLDPDLVWRTNGARAEINRNPRSDPAAFAPCPQPPLEALRALIAESRIALPDRLPPMAAGVFGYLGYDMVRLMEELPASHPDPIGIPDAVLIRPTLVVVFDAVQGHASPWSHRCARRPASRQKLRIRAREERLAGVVDALDRALDKAGADRLAGPLHIPAKSNTSPAEFRAMVQKAKDYILAGDIFQVVLSQRFEAPFALPPLALYRALRRVNPAPFLYFLDFGSYAVAGSSPEVLVRLRGGTVTIRPLAGTRPRGATPHDDKALEEELLADPKERAEHLMLLDLGRNDVGRVSKIGSVAVTDQFFIERYSHVMHIVSNVEGTLADKHDALDALAAGFPGRHGFRRAEGAGDADHRRAGEGEARNLCRLRRLFLRRRRNGLVHRAPHRADQGRHHVCAGRRRHRRRLRSGERTGRVRQQGQGAVSRRRRSPPIRESPQDAGSKGVLTGLLDPL